MFLLKTRAHGFALVKLYILMCITLGSTGIAAEVIQLQALKPALTARLTRSSSWPDGDVAVILHGTLSHRDTEIIQSLETLLNDENISTLAVNLSLGVEGRTQALPCEDLHLHREGDASLELARWSRWLRQEGVQTVTAIGHSRGALQIARYANDSADTLISRLVLIAPPLWSKDTAEETYTRRHEASLPMLLARAEAMIARGDGAKPMPEPVGLLYCGGARATAESFASYYADDPLRDTPTLLSKLSLPMLVVAGSNDDIAAGLPAAFAAGAPTVVVEEVEGADHFFRDLYADELVEIALEFMHNTP